MVAHGCSDLLSLQVEVNAEEASKLGSSLVGSDHRAVMQVLSERPELELEYLRHVVSKLSDRGRALSQAADLSLGSLDSSSPLQGGGSSGGLRNTKSKQKLDEALESQLMEHYIELLCQFRPEEVHPLRQYSICIFRRRKVFTIFFYVSQIPLIVRRACASGELLADV